jgi:hypothetical protein
MSKKPDLSIPEEEKGWLAAVGLMAIHWAVFESMMDGYLKVIATFPLEMGRQDIPSMNITFNKRIRFWKEHVLTLDLPQPTIKKSLTLADRARTARNHRDLLLHGMSYKAPDGRYMAIYTRAKGKEQHIPVSEQKILKVAHEIRVATADIFEHLEIVSRFALKTLQERYGVQAPPRANRQSPSTPDKP